MRPGATELIIILVLVLVLFGGRKLPDLARSIGTSMKEFRKATDELDDKRSTTRDEDPSAAPHRDEER